MRIISTIFLLSFNLCLAQVGINTKNPVEDLHVVGTIRYESTDANFPINPGYTLVSDADGNARWKNINLSKTSVTAVYNRGKNITNEYNGSSGSSGTKFLPVNTSITLPQGKWIIIMSIGVHVDIKKSGETTYSPLDDGRHVWVKVGLFDDDTTLADNNTATPDIIDAKYISGAIVGPNTNGLITGELFIDQSNIQPKTYYLKARMEHYTPTAASLRLTNFATDPSIVPENFIIAYPLNF